MLDALSIAIDLTLFYCFADTSPFGEKKVEEEYRAKAAQPLAICMQKFSKLFCSYAQYIEPAWWWTDFTCMHLFH